MLEYVKFAFRLLTKTIKEHGFSQLLRQQFFFNRSAIPFSIDLSALGFQTDPLLELGHRLIVLRREDVEAERWPFFEETRRLNALRHFKRGLTGFGLLNAENVVVGDIWCVIPRHPQAMIQHPDLEMLKVACAAGDVYAYDMFIASDFRGKKLAAPFHRSLELFLKQAGWRRLLDYYWEDNLPDRWMSWMLKSTELPKVRVTRFFLFKFTHQAPA